MNDTWKFDDLLWVSSTQHRIDKPSHREAVVEQVIALADPTPAAVYPPTAQILHLHPTMKSFSFLALLSLLCVAFVSAAEECEGM